MSLNVADPAGSLATQTDGIALRVEHLRAYYSGKLAVRDVNLNFKERKVTAIIGPSGCGKSTVLRCLNRMHEVVRGAHAEGKVFYRGEDIYASSVDAVRVRRRIGMVFQKPNPFPMMSIYDNVASGLKLTGEARGVNLDQVVEKHLRGAAIWDEVKDKLHNSGASLSGGQQQRLCIARALAVEPDILLMDEPCSALDPIATYKIEELIDELKANYTIIIVTHNMQQASRVSQETAFMLAGEERIGELVEFGETRTIFTSPAKKETEDYITGRFG
ncbi:MAG: phosphate ABC transporter ATP-binding protein PstB [Chloroflexota bacterium]